MGPMISGIRLFKAAHPIQQRSITAKNPVITPKLNGSALKNPTLIPHDIDIKLFGPGVIVEVKQ